MSLFGNILLARPKGIYVSNDDALVLFDGRASYISSPAPNILGSTEYLTGFNQQPDLGNYPDDINDLTETEINNLATGTDYDGLGSNVIWSTLEKVWILENLDTTSISGVKRYGFSFTYDTTTAVIPVPNSGALGIKEEKEELLFFDGANDYVSLGSTPDLTGTKTITFKAFIPSGTTQQTRLAFIFKANASDFLYVFIHITTGGSNSTIQVITGGSSQASSNKTYPLSVDFYGGYLIFEIIKGTSSITSLKINDITITPTTTTSGWDFDDGALIGAYGISSSLLYSNSGEGAYLYDINVNNSHAWAGYPAGDTDAAWEDSIGLIDGTVNGSPVTGDAILKVYDWNDLDSDGLGNDYTLAGSGQTVSIVTGNGFVGNAQRLAYALTSARGITSDLFAALNGSDYVLSLRFRCSRDGGSTAVSFIVRNSSNDNLLVGTIDINTGDALVHQSNSFTSDDTELYIIINTVSGATNSWYEIDEMELLEV